MTLWTRPLTPAAFLPWAAAAALAAPCLAQQGVQDIAPYWVATVGEDVQIRCGDRERYYAVAKVTPGTLLTVDGESGEWVRVWYPDDITPFAPKDDARKVNETTIELTRASGLRAPSLIMGPAGSWRSVYDPPLATGMKLDIVAEAKDDAGEVVGWMVRAPEPPASRTAARGYIARAQVRNATAAEVEAHQAALAAKGQPAPEAGAAKPIAVKPTPTKPAAPATAAPSTAQGSPEPVDTALLDEQVPPGTEPATAASTDALDIVAAVPAVDGPEVIDQSAAGPSTLATPVEVPETGLTAAKLQDLEGAFEAARALPREELDVALDELLAEYNRARAETTEEVVTRSLDQRIDWIELRIATREERRKLASVQQDVTEREVALRQRVAEWRSARAFTIVGRVLPSRVYDGRRLPLMYRVESVEPLSYSRTIGYIRPADPDEIAARLGQIVGIRGESAFDTQLRMNVITPLEVEALDNP